MRAQSAIQFWPPPSSLTSTAPFMRGASIARFEAASSAGAWPVMGERRPVDTAVGCLVGRIRIPGANLQLVTFRTLEVAGDHVDAAMANGSLDRNVEATQPFDVAVEMLGRYGECEMRAHVRIVLAHADPAVLRQGTLHEHIADAQEDVA